MCCLVIGDSLVAWWLRMSSASAECTSGGSTVHILAPHAVCCTMLCCSGDRFDGSKPWSLGVFLTCQVRMEHPATTASLLSSCTSGSPGGGGGSDGKNHHHQQQQSSAMAAVAGGSNDSDGGGSKLAAAVQLAQQQQQQPSMHLVDFGFVSTSATIAVREAGSSRRCEKSWEHAVVGVAAAAAGCCCCLRCCCSRSRICRAVRQAAHQRCIGLVLHVSPTLLVHHCRLVMQRDFAKCHSVAIVRLRM